LNCAARLPAELRFVPRDAVPLLYARPVAAANPVTTILFAHFDNFGQDFYFILISSVYVYRALLP
jgi:hypothetical protein